MRLRLAVMSTGTKTTRLVIEFPSAAPITARRRVKRAYEVAARIIYELFIVTGSDFPIDFA